MKELDKKAVKDLIRFYEIYIRDGCNTKTKSMAEKIHLEYTPGDTMLSDIINSAVSLLVDVYVNTGISPISKDKAKNILDGLKRLKKGM